MKRKLTAAIFSIAALALLLSLAAGLVAFYQRELESARETLNELLDLMDAQSYDTDPQALAAQFSTAAPSKRLTIVDEAGQVLADTSANPTENHADRPEIVEALADGIGEDIRRSATTGVPTLYVARQFTDGSVGRAATPLASVNAMLWQNVTIFLVALAVALILALLLSHRLAATAVKPVEEAEEAMEQVDETLQTGRMEFTANVTHELKTPLTSIKGFTDMLTSGMVTDPADQKRFLTMISVEADRLIGLINDVLKLSELESAVIPQPGQRADMALVARDVADLLRPVAGDITLTVEGDSVQAAIPEGRLREVILNLAENAVKYNRPGGSVTIGVEARGDKALLTVADTGIGIPAEAQSRVFERFYRVDKGRSKKVGGTGLGLAIVKHIVQIYGGEISLASVLGQGTTITVTLPAP